jgi:hypothetical protein
LRRGPRIGQSFNVADHARVEPCGVDRFVDRVAG